jgi:glycosyltransferase involved in cell wall biosynthesis
MHVLFIPAWLSVSKKNDQTGSFFVEQAQALKDNGVNVRILYIEKITLKKLFLFINNIIFKKIFTKNFYREGVECIINYSPSLYNNNIDKIILRKSYFKLIDQYINVYGEPNVIHIQSMNGMYDIPKLIKEKYNIKLVITEHSSYYFTNKMKNKDLLIFRNNLDYSDCFFTVSNFYADYLSSLTDISKIKVMPNNFSKKINEFKKINLDKNELFTFVSVGNLYDVKRHDLLINEFKKILNLNLNVQLIIVGDGNNKNKLSKMIRNAKIEKYVKLIGRKNRDETLKLIASSHVLVVSSQVETFSVVTIEALALKTLVITTKCGGPQMLINEKNGFVCEDNELSNKMLYLYENYSNYNLLKVQEDAFMRYSPNVVANKLIDVYKG